MVLLELPLQALLQLGAHDGTERGIDIGKRLIEQENQPASSTAERPMRDALQDVDRPQPRSALRSSNGVSCSWRRGVA